VVDDSEDNRYAVRRHLEQAGFRVVEGASGEETLRLAVENPDLIILDVDLPDTNGFEVCQQIKSNPATAAIPVLNLSATFTLTRHRVLGLDSGADSYLCHPVEPIELIATVNALLRVRRAEQALRDADRRKDEFLALLAHELRNPLAPIRNALEILRLAGDTGETVRRQRERLERQVAQLVRLVDDLLDVSRITTGKLRLALEPLTIQEVIESALDMSRSGIEKAKLTLAVDVPAEPIQLTGDRVRLAQVFTNILNNAAKFTEPGGRVSLTVAPAADGRLAVTIRDSGVGIPADILPQLFGLFTQVDRSLNRSQGGLGIGLAIVRRLVEMHGGTVTAHSDGPGTGAEFVVTLPTK
jgi:signal transduction histidine kinase